MPTKKLPRLPKLSKQPSNVAKKALAAVKSALAILASVLKSAAQRVPLAAPKVLSAAKKARNAVPKVPSAARKLLPPFPPSSFLSQSLSPATRVVAGLYAECRGSTLYGYDIIFMRKCTSFKIFCIFASAIKFY